MRAWRWLGLATLSWVMLAGCGGPKKGQAGEAKDPSDQSTEETPTWEGGGEGEEVPDSELSPSAGKEKFDEEQAKVVLARGARKAAECPKVIKEMPHGEGSVEVVFDGQKGQTVEVILGSLFAGASEQGQQCIKNAFLGEFIPPFPGKKTVEHTFTIP